MRGSIFILDEAGKFIELEKKEYDSETVLQELLDNYPSLLAGDQINQESPRKWLPVAREAPIPDGEKSNYRWSLDHLFLDQDGIPTLVEVKRSSDTRIRREVVGQMLDYASHSVQYWTADRIQFLFENYCENNGKDPEVELREFLVDGQIDDYWQKVKTNLQAKRIRLVFVADAIPLELARVVEFLN